MRHDCCIQIQSRILDPRPEPRLGKPWRRGDYPDLRIYSITWFDRYVEGLSSLYPISCPRPEMRKAEGTYLN